MTRLKANQKIIELLSDTVEKNPDWRFGQLLVNVGFEYPSFFTESVDSLEELSAFLNHFMNGESND